MLLQLSEAITGSEKVHTCLQKLFASGFYISLQYNNLSPQYNNLSLQNRALQLQLIPFRFLIVHIRFSNKHFASIYRLSL